MDVYRVEFRGVRHLGEVLPTTSRCVLLDGFPGEIDGDVVEAIRKAIGVHVGRHLGWDGVQVLGLTHLGRSLPPICRD